MRGLIRWSVNNPTIINLMMVGLCLMGLLSLLQMPKETFPDTNLDLVIVRVVLRGAGPSEMEKGVIIKIEESIQGIAGIEEITSEAKENLASIQISLSRGADAAKVLRDVKDAVEQINSFPADAEKPVVFEVTRKLPVVNLALHGNVPRATLQTLADKIKDQLLAKSGIRQVEVQGKKNREISIEINDASLRKYKLQITDVARALRTSNLDLSGGMIKTKREDLLVRVYAKKYRAKELENIVVRTLPGGNHIRIRDVAKAKESFEDRSPAYYFNGEPAMQIAVQRLSDGNALSIVAAAKEFLVDVQSILPKGIKLSLDRDTTVTLKERIALLAKNGAQGLVLVLITLALLMNIRLAFWVAAGLPVSIFTTFSAMQFIGVSVNVLSLFGLILVIGILVDDAIVVSENIYSHLERGKSPTRAAIDGAAEVMPAVLASVLSTCFAFMPLFFMGGLIGKFVFAIPAVVISALLVSLIEAFMILPPHLAHSLKPRNSAEYKVNRFRAVIDTAFQVVNKRFYAGVLRKALKYRWIVAASSFAALFLTFGLIGGGLVKFVFFPDIDGDRIVARFTMQPGTPQSRTEEIAKRLERAGRELNKELKEKYGQAMVKHSTLWVGRSTLISLGFSSPSGEEVAEVQLQLISSEIRKASSFEIINRWRKRMGAIPGATQSSFGSVGGPPLGRAMELRLLSQDSKQLRLAADYLRNKISGYSGIEDPQDDLNLGKRELRMKLTPLAKSLGVTLQELALQLRYRVYGQEVMRLQRGRDEVRVFVRYPENDRRSVAALSELGIRTRTGSSIPLGKLVTWKYKRQLKVVRRVDRKRLATVFSNLDDTRGNRQEIVTSLRKSVLPAVVKLAPAVKVEFAGQGKEQAKVFGGMKFALPIALFAILVLLVAVFRSYVQAGIIMIMIVFGLIGAVLGHMILGMPVTILSFFGVVGLAGIVVNDSLVLMDSVNRHIEEGYAIHDAAWLAGQSRLRAILSTTLTTFVGLMPLIAEKSLQAQFLIPMAISVAFGVLFATVITLIMVPSYFLITNDLRRIRYWIWNGVWVTPEIVDPTAKRLREEKEREEMEEEVEEDKKKAASGGGHGSSGGSLGGGHGSHPQGPLHHPPAGHYPPGHGAPTPGHPVSPVPPTGDYPQPSFSTPPNPHR